MSQNHSEHYKHLETVFKRLRQHCLTVNPNKGVIGQESVQFLGYLISPDGYKPPEARVQAARDFVKPDTI